MKQNFASNRFINQPNATPDKYLGRFNPNYCQKSPMMMNDQRVNNIVNYNEIKNNFTKILNENIPSNITPKIRESRVLLRDSIESFPITRKLNKHHDLNKFGLKGSRSRESKHQESSIIKEIKKYDTNKVTITNESKQKLDSNREREDRSLSEFKPSIGSNLLAVKEIEIENLKKENYNLKENCSALENRFYKICLQKDDLREKLIETEKNHTNLKRELLAKFTEIKGLESVVNSLLKYDCQDRSTQETSRKRAEEDQKALKKEIENLSFDLKESRLQNLKLVQDKESILGQMSSKEHEIEKLNAIIRNYQERIISYYKRSSEQFSNEFVNPIAFKDTTDERRESFNRMTDSPNLKLETDKGSPSISFKVSIKENVNKY